MKNILFHLQGYRDLPDDFRDRYESVWVTPPSDELCDPETVGKYFQWNIDELEYGDELGFDGIGINEHHQNAYGFCPSPNMIAALLARRKSDAAVVVLGATMPLYNPAIRVAEELALVDCISGGRLVVGLPIGTPQDVSGCYGMVPTMVRPRYYEAHKLLLEAWTRPGPFAFNGRFNKLRYVNPWPKPIQKPLPPIWLAGGGSVETWKFAVDNNYTYNYLSTFGYLRSKVFMDGYWDMVEKAGLDDNPYRAGFAQMVVVADTDAEAEKLYLEHIRNFYLKNRHMPNSFANIPGSQTQQSVEFAVRKNMAANYNIGDPLTDTWADFTEKSKRVIGGSPDTVVAELETLCRQLRVGHLIVLLQIQSMDTELTKYNMKMFAEKVMPRIAHLWDDEGYVDHWWPQNAAKGSRVALAGKQPAGA